MNKEVILIRGSPINDLYVCFYYLCRIIDVIQDLTVLEHNGTMDIQGRYRTLGLIYLEYTVWWHNVYSCRLGVFIGVYITVMVFSTFATKLASCARN
jgi:hypothetical protein